jgi:RNA polymerase-interacting CarD/CdnL/TRCF family regulator
VFIDEIETCSIRTLKKEEELAKVQVTLQRSEKEAKEIGNQIKKEKQVQIECL